MKYIKIIYLNFLFYSDGSDYMIVLHNLTFSEKMTFSLEYKILEKSRLSIMMVICRSCTFLTIANFGRNHKLEGKLVFPKKNNFLKVFVCKFSFISA